MPKFRDKESWLRYQAEVAVENAETAAQLEIKDDELRASLVRNIVATFRPLVKDPIDA